jgi:hypothetical protein
MFVTAEGSSGAIFWRAIERRNVIAAESAAREMPNVPLDFALALVHLYADKRDRRFERAALRYLERYMAETNPSLDDVAGVAALLAERRPA